MASALAGGFSGDQARGLSLTACSPYALSRHTELGLKMIPRNVGKRGHRIDWLMSNARVDLDTEIRMSALCFYGLVILFYLI
jgi:hypothetical protein